MIGTLLNIATVLLGGSLGLFLGGRLPERLKGTVTAGMGLFTAVIGVQMFLKTQNPLIVLGSLSRSDQVGTIGLPRLLQRFAADLDLLLRAAPTRQDSQHSRLVQAHLTVNLGLFDGRQRHAHSALLDLVTGAHGFFESVFKFCFCVHSFIIPRG